MITAIYDLSLGPVTFDATVFMVYADAYRRSVGDDSMRVVFVPGEEDGFRQKSPRDKVYSTERKTKRLWNILVPLARLLPACTGIEVLSTRGELARVLAETPPEKRFPIDGCPYLYGYVAKLHEHGIDPRALAPRSVSPVGDYATITLRRSDFQPNRNTDISAMESVRDHLESLGLTVYAVPDTENPEEYGTLSPYLKASFDLDARMALYDGAKVNVMTSNGPAVLPVYSLKSPPYLICKMSVVGYNSTDPMYMAKQGYPVGKNYPFANDNQRLLWRDESSLISELKVMGYG